MVRSSLQRTLVNSLVGIVAAGAMGKCVYEGWWRRDSWVSWDAGLHWAATTLLEERPFPESDGPTAVNGGSGKGEVKVKVNSPGPLIVVKVLDGRSNRVLGSVFVKGGQLSHRKDLVFTGLAAGNYQIVAKRGDAWFGDRVGLRNAKNLQTAPTLVRLEADALAAEVQIVEQ